MFSFDPRLARQVKADSLEPAQQPTPPAFQTATDFRQQVMLKFPHLADFHSFAEHLDAGLLEGDPHVQIYVPHPFRLRIGKRRYTPDCYVVADNQPRRVRELRPRGEMSDALRVPLTHFFAQHGMRFEVIDNEAVYARATEAENWLEIVRILHQARDLATAHAEYAVLERVRCSGACTLGDVIAPGDRASTYRDEIALFRLLHRGTLCANLTSAPLDFDTEIAPCA